MFVRVWRRRRKSLVNGTTERKIGTGSISHTNTFENPVFHCSCSDTNEVEANDFE